MNPSLARSIAVPVAVVVALGVGATPAPANPGGSSAPVVDPDYVLSLLAPIDGGSWSAATGLSDAGEVVGTARTTTTFRPQHAARWRPGGGAATDLGVLPGATFSRAFDIADNGTAVGEGFTAAPESSRPLLWRPDGEMIVLGSLNDGGSGVAQDVNGAGRVVGVSFNGEATRAFIGDERGIRELPLPDIEETVTTTRATGIAENGTTVGTSFVVQERDGGTRTVGRATTWRDFGATLLPGADEEIPSAALGVSDDGSMVAGEEAGAPGSAATWGAVVWEDGERRTLPSLEGLRHARANAVADDGTVVGHGSGFYGNASFDGRAALWRDGEVTDLNTLVDLPEGVVLRNASDINDVGVVVGTADTPDGNRGFVLTPEAADAPAPTHVHADVAPTEYGERPTVEVSVHAAGSHDDDVPMATGDVQLRVPGRVWVTSALADGRASLQGAGTWLPGRYQGVVRYSGDERHEAAQDAVTLTVRRARTVTVAKVRRADRRSRVVATVTSPASDMTVGGRILVRVDGRLHRQAELRGGRVAVALPRLAAGRHRVVVSYQQTRLTRGSTDQVRFRTR